MNESYRKIFYILGIIAAIYLGFKYLLPLIGFAFKAIIVIIMWAAIGLMVFLLIAYILKLIKNND